MPDADQQSQSSRNDDSANRTSELGDYRSAWSTRRIPASRYPTSVQPGPVELLVTLALWTVTGFMAYLGIWQNLCVTLVVLAFAGLALFLSHKLYEGARHRLRYDRGVFVMDEFPAVQGGMLRGTVETGISIEDRPPNGFCVRVTCGKARPGPQATGSFRRLWHTEQQVEGQPCTDGEGIAVPVDIDLPEDQPSSTLDDTPPTTHWRMSIRAEGADPPYEQRFEIPVLPPDHRLA